MRTRYLGIPILAGLLTASLVAPAHAASWKIEGPVATNMGGVSPHVERTARGDLVFRSDGPAGTSVSLCTDAGCTPVTFNAGGGPINDVTIATLPSGAKRAYFVDVNPSAGTKTVSSAPCLDADCLSLGTRTPIAAGASVALTTKAWGVPDAVVLPDGRVRVYMVESPVPGICTEKIASYISSDGITFTKEPGWRLENGYVDTEILRTQSGSWLMILADIGCTSDRNQKLFVSESADGLTWSAPQALTGAGNSKLDPTGYEIAPNQFRIYYATGGASMGQFGPIERATLVIGTPSVATPGTAKQITCKKGKKTKVITATKCPAGTKQVK
jgi:hypothetical protein